MINRLIQLVEKGNLASVQTFLDDNPEVDINGVGDTNCNALIKAANKGHYEIAKLLLERGANPNALDDDATMVTSPFVAAAMAGRFQIMDMLLQYGVDINLNHQSLMYNIGLGLQELFADWTVFDYLKDHGFNVNTSTLGLDFIEGEFQTASWLSFLSGGGKGEGLLYFLGTFQDEIDLSNEHIRKRAIKHYINKVLGPKHMPPFEPCILSKVSGYLVLINLLNGYDLDIAEQNFINNLSKKLLDIIAECSSVDKIKNELFEVSNYLELKEQQFANKVLIANKKGNQYNFDYLVKAWSKTEQILPPSHPLYQALKDFIPLVHQVIENHFNQKNLAELYYDKTIAEVNQDTSVPALKVGFRNLDSIQQNHPHLFQVVKNLQEFLDPRACDSMQHFCKVKNVRFQTLLKESVAFQEMVEENKALSEVIELTSHLSYLKSDLLRELYELIGPEMLERFGNAKFSSQEILNDSSAVNLEPLVSQESIAENHVEAIGMADIKLTSNLSCAEV